MTKTLTTRTADSIEAIRKLLGALEELHRREIYTARLPGLGDIYLDEDDFRRLFHGEIVEQDSGWPPALRGIRDGVTYICLLGSPKRPEMHLVQA